jgi:hypothetical protein
MMDNIRNLRNPTTGSLKSLTDKLNVTPNGGRFQSGGRTYEVRQVGDDLTLMDVDLPGSNIKLTELMDELLPPVAIKNGAPRVDMTAFETKLKNQFSDLGKPAQQADIMAKAEMDRIRSGPAVRRLSTIDEAAKAADQSVTSGGRASNRVNETSVVRSAADDVKLGQWSSEADVRRTLSQTDVGTFTRSADNINTALDNAPRNSVRALAGVTDDAAKLTPENLQTGLKNLEAAGKKAETLGTISKSALKQLLAIAVAGVVLGAVLPSIIPPPSPTFETSSPPPATKTVTGVAQAAAQSTAPPTDASKMSEDFVALGLVAVAQQHQKDMNGCWLFDKSNGTMTKVKLLTCGQLVTENGLETCATQTYVPGKDAEIRGCASGTFNPCLKSSTQRTPNLMTPRVPNVCNAYLYNSSNQDLRPTTIAGVTTTDACANASTQPCSTYCKTESFNLPVHMQLICVDVDFATAYADLMGQLGIQPAQLFSSVRANANSNPSAAGGGASSKGLWVGLGIAVGVLVLLGVVAYVTAKPGKPA